ncbi:murein hydrolase activator EnvC precursor [Mariprofundus micogutta]|uniref:Murein hydrolase activator EnvC n=1 Tax=Mariprofundus micogutta TaxID=1921010 RepID=A0A1L8CMG0_9PROT|nr:peptidoglycan DD-metalloendopeptidase family protein [Mariprofundus micogutta]GAV20098.1 murein hydrolase activator EnvC precursor [Mariprofundus micogutta]
MKALFRILSVFLMLAWIPCTADLAAAAGLSTEQKIERIKQERKKLAKVKRKLENQLGSVGKEMRTLDAALIKARKSSRAARDKVRATDKKLAGLKHKSKQLQKRIVELKQAMLNQAVAAWKRSSRTSEWMGLFTGVSVSDIPHRRYLLNGVMSSQADDRRLYTESIAELATVKAELQQQRVALDKLRIEKKKAAFELSKRVDDKRKVLNRVRKEMSAKKSKDKHLAREEKALLRLLDGMSQELLSMDKQDGLVKKVRKRKGRLAWPLPGRIVASFHSRPKSTMPRLQGVQLKPKSRVKAVKAMASGQVRYADWFGGYGLMTIVDYGEGVLGVYAHNDVLYKQLGDWVEEGEMIADAGSTGWVNKVTVYFEIRDRGKAVNPKRWCRR